MRETERTRLTRVRALPASRTPTAVSLLTPVPAFLTCTLQLREVRHPESVGRARFGGAHAPHQELRLPRPLRQALAPHWSRHPRGWHPPHPHRPGPRDQLRDPADPPDAPSREIGRTNFDNPKPPGRHEGRRPQARRPAAATSEE